MLLVSLISKKKTLFIHLQYCGKISLSITKNGEHDFMFIGFFIAFLQSKKVDSLFNEIESDIFFAFNKVSFTLSEIGNIIDCFNM